MMTKTVDARVLDHDWPDFKLQMERFWRPVLDAIDLDVFVVRPPHYAGDYLVTIGPKRQESDQVGII